MTREELIRNLKYTMKKHEHDRVDTFGTNISLMCKDMLDYLEQESCVDIEAIYKAGYSDGKFDGYNSTLIEDGYAESHYGKGLDEINKKCGAEMPRGDADGKDDN